MIDPSKVANRSAVQSLVFEARLLTPLFTHGWQARREVNNRPRVSPVAAETRASSLRGGLRYWWRAVQDEDDAGLLLEEEGRVFGGSSGTTGNKSPIAIKITSLTSRNSAHLRPHRNETPALAIPASARPIKIELMFTPFANAPALSYYRSVMELFFCLGSMGQRARRGTGALQYEGFRWNSVADFQASLRDALQGLDVQRNFEFPSPDRSDKVLTATNTRQFTYPKLVAVWVGRSYNDPEEARRAISAAASNHNGRNNRMLGNAVGGRLASPLWCTVRKIGNGYRPIISELANPNMEDQNYRRVRNNFLGDLGVNRP